MNEREALKEAGKQDLGEVLIQTLIPHIPFLLS